MDLISDLGELTLASRLRATGRLYCSLGFRRTRRHPFPDDTYQRETITMVLDLNHNEESPS